MLNLAGDLVACAFIFRSKHTKRGAISGFQSNDLFCFSRSRLAVSVQAIKDQNLNMTRIQSKPSTQVRRFGSGKKAGGVGVV